VNTFFIVLGAICFLELAIYSHFAVMTRETDRINEKLDALLKDKK
jgi:hypothetical protein